MLRSRPWNNELLGWGVWGATRLAWVCCWLRWTYVFVGVVVALHEGDDDVVDEVAHGEDSGEGGEVGAEFELGLPVRDVDAPRAGFDRDENE